MLINTREISVETPLFCKTGLKNVRSVVIAVVKAEFMVFWVNAPCNVVDGYQRFRGPFYLHL
jgi:hypothetical protein